MCDSDVHVYLGLNRLIQGVPASELRHQERPEDLLSVQPHFISAAQKQSRLSINPPPYKTASAQLCSQGTPTIYAPFKQRQGSKALIKVQGGSKVCYLSVWVVRYGTG